MIRYSPPPSVRPFLIAWVTYLILMLLVPVLFLSRLHIPEKADFGCFYVAGVLARTNPSHLYDVTKQMTMQVETVGAENGWTVFIQPPYEALLLVPFSMLPYRDAYLCYLACNVLLIVPCFLVARDAFSNFIDPWQPKPGLLFFFFIPLFTALLQGQGSVRLLLVCCATWYELKRGKDFSGGFLLALALFKMQVIVPMALLIAVWRGFRFLSGFLTCALGLFVASFWLVGLTGMQAFLKLLVASSLIQRDIPAEIPAAGLPASLMPNLRGLLYGGGGKFLPHSWLLGLTLALSGAFLAWLVYLLREERDPATSFALSMLGALLLSYYLHVHDLAVLLLPLALLAARVLPYFTAVVWVCFLLPVLLLVGLGIYASYLLAVPLLGLVWIVAQESRIQLCADPRLEPELL